MKLVRCAAAPLAACATLLLLSGCAGSPAGRTAAVQVPAAAPIPADQALQIVAPGLRTVLIVADDLADLHAPHDKYVFPYVGGHLHLKRHLDWIAQTNLPVLPASQFAIQHAKQPFDVRIWIGTQPKVREALGRDLDTLDEDGFIIKADGADLYIAGRYVWATEFAVYDLLERFAGCRFYAPGPDVWVPADQWEPGLFNIVPRSPVVAIPKTLFIRDEPVYKARQMRFMPTASFRQRRRDYFHHNLQRTFIPPELLKPGQEQAYRDWCQAHLAWFPEIGGVRTPPRQSNSYDFQPCVGNPDVRALLEKDIRKAFTEDGVSSFSLGMNDSGNYCQCARCMALVPSAWQGKLDSNQTNAFVFFSFYNQMAERLYKDFPHKRLGCLAYAALSLLPEGAVKLHPMIVPYLTRDSAQLFDANEVKEFRETVDKWSRIATRMGIYEYFYGGGFIIPRLYNRYLFKNIKERYGVGVDGFYAEDYPNWGLDGFKYWITMKLLWNPAADPAALKAQYCRDLYGPAAEAMSAYYDDLEETWCTQESRGVTSNRSNYRWLNEIRQLAIFPPDRCESAWALISRAEQELAAASAAQTNAPEKAYGEESLRRVRFHKAAFELTRTMGTLYANAAELNTLTTTNAPFNYAAALTAFDRVFKMPALAAIFDRCANLKEGTLRAFDGSYIFHADSGDSAYPTFVYHFGRFPGLNRAIRRMTDELMPELLSAQPADPAATRAAAVRALRARVGAQAAARFPETLDRLAAIIADTGLFVVQTATADPVVDGAIADGEWGAPVFDGRFFADHTTYPAPERTTLWACHRNGRTYLAFRCEQPTNSIATSVGGIRTDQKAECRMARDDAIALTLHRPKTPYESLRFNAAGAWSDNRDPSKPQPYTVKTRKTDTGWEAEVAIDGTLSMFNPAAAKDGPVTVCIARYAHDPAAPKVVQASTLAPIAEPATGGGTIGNGNHTSLMTFIWGARLIYR